MFAEVAALVSPAEPRARRLAVLLVAFLKGLKPKNVRNREAGGGPSGELDGVSTIDLAFLSDRKMGARSPIFRKRLTISVVRNLIPSP